MAWGDVYTMRQLVGAARAAGFTAEDAVIAGAVAMAESDGRMVVNNASGETPSSLRGRDRCASYGPWQINYCPTRDRGSIREVAATTPTLAANVKAAKAVHASQGWGAWTMYTNGGYREHLSEAKAAAGGGTLGEQLGREVGERVRGGTDAVGDAVRGVSSPFGQVGTLLDVLGDPRRLGYFALGGFVAVVAVVLIVAEVGPDVAAVIPTPAAQVVAAAGA